MGKFAYQVLGENVAEGNLSIDDGVNGKIDGHGHFTHHPYHGGKYQSQFELVKQL